MYNRIFNFYVLYKLGIFLVLWPQYCLPILPIDGTYFGLQGGRSFIPKISLNEYKASNHFGGYIGIRSQTIRYEGEVILLLNKGKNFSGQTNVGSLMFNMYYDFICPSRSQSCSSINPFLSGGIGYSVVESARTLGGGGTAYPFSYQGKAGINYNLTQTFAVSAWYRYFKTLNVTHLRKQPFQSHLISLGLTWNMG